MNGEQVLMGEGGWGAAADGTHQVMMYCMCSFLRVTLVCPPMGPPGTVLSAETVSSASLISVPAAWSAVSLEMF